MPGRLPVYVSRNMVIIREGDRLVLINSCRLDAAGLAALDALGRVTDVIRLAGNHGMDDPFYKDRYGAKVWAVRGQRYKAGFGSGEQTYFEPDLEMDATTELPLAGAKLYVIDSKPPEGILIVERHDGVAVTGDCLQHWHAVDPYCNWLGKQALRMMGFVKPHAVGPAWLKHSNPPRDQLRGILSLRFANLLPSHGAAVIGEALSHYRPAIERVS
jgi:hypothetical protein